jgi:hypothetical protein
MASSTKSGEPSIGTADSNYEAVCCSVSVKGSLTALHRKTCKCRLPRIAVTGVGCGAVQFSSAHKFAHSDELFRARLALHPRDAHAVLLRLYGQSIPYGPEHDPFES